MTLMEQAERRVALARETGREPLRWIATDTIATELSASDVLLGVPLERGDTRHGLELVCARAE